MTSTLPYLGTGIGTLLYTCVVIHTDINTRGRLLVEVSFSVHHRRRHELQDEEEEAKAD
jgi:hypothetical protein